MEKLLRDVIESQISEIDEYIQIREAAIRECQRSINGFQKEIDKKKKNREIFEQALNEK